jgi:hypothetical protein
MSAITDLCRGQPCYVGLPDVCNGNSETTVPAHIRRIGISGAGIKAPDIFACPACFNCHDALDGRRYKDLDRDYVQLAHYKALIDWQYELWQREIITIAHIPARRSAKG